MAESGKIDAAHNAVDTVMEGRNSIAYSAAWNINFRHNAFMPFRMRWLLRLMVFTFSYPTWLLTSSEIPSYRISLPHRIFQIFFILSTLFIAGFNGLAHAGWSAGASLGCFDTYLKALNIACANNNPDITSTPSSYWWYRDSCIQTSDSSHIVYAHRLTLSTGEILPFSYTGSLGTCSKEIDVGKNVGVLNNATSGYCPTGNPINQGTGNKFQVENDYKDKSLEFTRYYNSTTLQRPGIFSNWLETVN